MPDPVDALVLDLLEWVAMRERTYSEVIDAWRTSCPRLPVWEEANDRGFLQTEYAIGGSVVRVTAVGFAHLNQERQAVNPRSAPP